MTGGEYDYIVVGAGSAGCVLANRLSGAHSSVLLLEAGKPDEKREISVPAAFSQLFESEVDWDYYTEPQAEMGGRELYWPRGKTLGGSSSINAMIYIRGHRVDYDEWADRGNEGWGYDSVLEYFKKSEHFAAGHSKYHGKEGPLNVADPRSPNEISEAFVDAADAAGYGRNRDFNGERQAGFGTYHLTQKEGSRHSAADAFLKPALGRPNLEALTGAQVTAVTIEEGRATGVEYRREGRRQSATAGEEVILAAGAVNSPQLLMLSGVGDPDHLAEHDIEVEQALPGVGRNLQDHLFAFTVYDATTSATLDDAENLLNFGKYLLLNRGPLTSNVGEAGGFVRTEPGLDAPDVQFHFAPAYFMRHGFDNPEGHGVSIGATQLRPESRGRIELASADPFDDPLIDPQYLTEENDVETLVEGVKIAREIAATPPLSEYCGTERWPGEAAQSDEEIAEHVRETAHTVYHPVGTCRMGDGDDAVVDDQLRVHGVDDLRVVDASVMPTLTGGNTNAPTIMIAERAADLIAG